jgi:probable rRNA maturation factor
MNPTFPAKRRSFASDEVKAQKGEINSVSSAIIGIQVDDEFEAAIDQSAIETLVRRTLASETLPVSDVELAIVIGGDAQIQELNRQYRGVDAPTDVLSFAMLDGPDMASAAYGQEAPLYLGDVIISYPRALAQAAEAGHSSQEELELLTVHGVLHLAGYDHDTDQRKATMWARQDAILGKHLVD